MLRFLMTMVSPGGRGPARIGSPRVSSCRPALVGLALIAAVWFVSGRSADPALPAVGETRRAAPEFALPGLDGGTDQRAGSGLDRK